MFQIEVMVKFTLRFIKHHATKNIRRSGPLSPSNLNFVIRGCVSGRLEEPTTLPPDKYKPEPINEDGVHWFYGWSESRGEKESSAPACYWTPISCSSSPYPSHYTYYYYSVGCLTTGPKPLPKRFLHIVRSKASSFKWEYPLLSLRSSSSFLCLLPRLLVTFISFMAVKNFMNTERRGILKILNDEFWYWFFTSFKSIRKQWRRCFRIVRWLRSAKIFQEWTPWHYFTLHHQLYSAVHFLRHFLPDLSTGYIL